MSKPNLVLSTAVSAALLVFAGAAQAGSITAPAAGSPVSYAVEAITATTDITLPDVEYTMGVARTTAQDFTIIYRLPDGILFNATPAAPTIAGGGAGTVTLKRGGAGTNEVVYDIDVTTALTTSTTITLVAPVLANSNLTAVGNTLAISVDLWETGETARVDNLTALSRTVAIGASAAALVSTSCADATTDANHTTPLGAFVAANGDTALRGNCDGLRVNNTTAGVRAPDNSGDYTLVAGDVVTLTITDPTGFLGLAANGLYYDLNDNNTNDAGEGFTISGNTATRTLAGDNGALNAAHNVNYVPTGTTPMGTARVLAVAGGLAPAVGAAVNLGGNTAWWTWGSNGLVLQSPWFSTFGNGYTNRFILMNTGANAVTYSTTVLTEGGNVATMGTGQTGTIPAEGTVVIDSADIATFSGATRGAVTFTVNAPASAVKGTFQQVNPISGQVTNVPLERVYGGSTF